MSLLAVSQISELAALVYEVVPAGGVMVENLEELLRIRVEDKIRAKFAPSEYAGTFVMPTSDQLPKVALPFMPECIRYIGCKAIKLAGGLFVPCGGKTKTEFCAACLKKAAEKGKHEYGTLDERNTVFEKGELYTIGDKTEITFGDFMAAKKLDQPTVKASLRQAGLSLNIPMRCLVITEGAKKKRSGRPTKAAAAAAEAGSEAGSDEEAAPQPKTTRVKLTIDEKLAKFKADEEAKAAKAAEREAKIAENKAKREAQKAEKDAKKAALKNAHNEAAPEKKTKKTAAVQEQMAALDELPEPEFKLIKQKGVTMKYYAESGKVYSETDQKNLIVLGNWNDEKKAVNFLPNMAACMVISDQIQHERTGDAIKSDMRFMMAGAVFTVKFKEGEIVCKKPPSGFILHLDDDMQLCLEEQEEEEVLSSDDE
jgi:hypothetical protein